MLKKTIVRLSLRFLITTVVSIVISSFIFLTAISLSTKAWLLNLFTVFTALIYGIMIYSNSWREAQLDRNRVKYGHMNQFLAKGILSALLATIPFVIMLIIYAINIHGSYWVYLVYLILNLPYLSWITAFKENALALSLLLLPMIAFAGIGYLLGWKDFSITEKLVYKNKAKRKKTAAQPVAKRH